MTTAAAQTSPSNLADQIALKTHGVRVDCPAQCVQLDFSVDLARQDINLFFGDILTTPWKAQGSALTATAGNFTLTLTAAGDKALLSIATAGAYNSKLTIGGTKPLMEFHGLNMLVHVRYTDSSVIFIKGNIQIEVFNATSDAILNGQHITMSRVTQDTDSGFYVPVDVAERLGCTVTFKGSTAHTTCPLATPSFTEVGTLP